MTNEPQNPAQQPPPPARPLKGEKAMLEKLGIKSIAAMEKHDKATTLYVTVYPTHGGGPYEEQVKVEEGSFTLPDSDLTYLVTPGSVWKGKDGKRRTIVNEANGQTINIAGLTSDNVPRPEAINQLIHTNVMRQWADETRNRNGWRTAGAIGLGVFAVLLIGAIIWAMVSIGNDLEAIRSAIGDIRVSSAPSGTSVGHQPIAPGGR